MVVVSINRESILLTMRFFFPFTSNVFIAWIVPLKPQHQHLLLVDKLSNFDQNVELHSPSTAPHTGNNGWTPISPFSSSSFLTSALLALPPQPTTPTQTSTLDASYYSWNLSNGNVLLENPFYFRGLSLNNDGDIESDLPMPSSTSSSVSLWDPIFIGRYESDSFMSTL